MYCCRGQMLNSLEWRHRLSVWLEAVLSLPCRVNIYIYYDILTWGILRYLFPSVSLSSSLSLLLTADLSWQCTSPSLIFKSLVLFYVIYILLQFIFIPGIPINFSHSSPHLSPPLPSFLPFSWHFRHSLSLSLFASPSIYHFLLSCLICADSQHKALRRVDSSYRGDRCRLRFARWGVYEPLKQTLRII